MIEFFTGAYVAFRQMGKLHDAEDVGMFTSTILAKHGYAACCKMAGVPMYGAKTILHV